MNYLLPIFFKKKRVELGEGHVDAYTIFESKYLGSIIVYNWKTIKQDRAHSHAFASVAFLLNGGYNQLIWENGNLTPNTVNKRFKFRYLPRNFTHQILDSKPNTWTIIFTGPWIKFWYELFPETNTWVKYTWGRKVIGKSNEFPNELRSE
jgi:hypothetical protein